METLRVKCQSCDRQLSSFFCGDCRTAVPIPRGVDYFRYLGLPQRPLIDEAELERTYLRLSQEYHPDRHPGLDEEQHRAILHRSALLNQAYLCLKDPKRRVQYLVELLSQGERSSTRAIPEAVARLFREVQTALSEADGYLREAERPKSALEQAAFALRAPEGEAHRRALSRCRDAILQQQEEALAELAAIDAAWDEPGEGSEAAYHRLAALADTLAYLDRLEGQVHERLTALRMAQPPSPTLP
ncbi:MAG: hypothetical protein D6739_09795 [Nitrospirae bacterium]|nr:MAG: hypothetical protein D6739_09795 [Nitrospirota bacterium]